MAKCSCGEQDYHLKLLTILVKTIVNTNNNTLAKSIANTNTDTFVTILFTVYHIQQRSFLSAVIY